MQAKPYPQAKRKILIEQSEVDFIAFLREVTDPTGRQFIRQKLLQNQVRGFRPGRAPLERTVPILITKLKSEQELTNCDSRIWNSLTNVWTYWVKSHPELDNILTTFDNGADFDEDHKCTTPPNSELDIECFKFLLEASHNALVPREMVNRFYKYGYFNEDERIRNLINQIPLCKEIKRRQQLAVLPEKVDGLFQAINKLSQNIENLNSRISAVESADELEQKLTEQIAKERQHFDTELQKLEQIIIDKHNQFDNQISNMESNSNQLVGLVRRIGSLEVRLSNLSESVNSFEDKLPEIESVDRKEIDQLVNQGVQDRIKQLNSHVPQEIKSMEVKLDAAEVAISEIKSKMIDGPKVSVRALEIGEQLKTELERKTERYSDENDYLDNFCHYLRRSGITDSGDEEMARAIHIALKAFPAIEIIDDARIMQVWQLICDNHFRFTTINVEIGWLGLQDWFPDLFARQCLGERLEPVDLKASIGKMLELGNMLWTVYFRYCDKSFPDTYLSGFLDWVNDFCKGCIRVFLIRCSGTNRCQLSEDFYERVARLPKPKNRAPINSLNLRPSKIPLTLSEWESWCQPNPETNSQYEEHHAFLEDLRITVDNRDLRIPIELLREIQHYLLLSHNIMAKTRALDWALTLRLLPWIGNRRKLIDVVLNFINNENQELPHFQEGLQVASEADQ